MKLNDGTIQKRVMVFLFLFFWDRRDCCTNELNSDNVVTLILIHLSRSSFAKSVRREALNESRRRTPPTF